MHVTIIIYLYTVIATQNDGFGEVAQQTADHDKHYHGQLAWQASLALSCDPPINSEQQLGLVASQHAA